MSVTDPAKWTCPHPDCRRRTITVYASEPDQRAAIEAIQRRHAKAHAEAAAILARLGLPTPIPRTQRRKKAA